MTLQEIKNTLKEWAQNSHRNDKETLNVCYFLIKNYHYAKSIKNIDETDLMILYDNLTINNEIITSDNIDEYDTEKLGLSTKTINKIKKGVIMTL